MSEFAQYILASSPVVVYSRKVGGDYRTTYISEKVADLLGYAPDEFIDDSRFWNDHIHPDDLGRVLSDLGALLKDGHYTHEYRFRAKSGEYRWMRDEIRLVRNQAKGVDELVGSWLDITARKELEEKYRQISGFTSDYVHCCTRKGMEPFKIQWVDGAVKSMTGYSNEEILAMGCWLQLVHPDDRQAVSNFLLSLVSGDRKRIEFRIVTKEQEVRWVLEKIQCEAGQALGELILYGGISDITARKRFEENLRTMNHDLQQQTAALEEANRELEAFSYTLSHDLGSYLARINLAGEALQEIEGEHLGTDGISFLQTILSTCQSMDDLIATMLTLAHSSRQELQLQQINLSDLAEHICGEITHVEPDRTLRFDIAPGLHVTADAHLLRVAMENLLGNACKYTKGKPEACISVSVIEQDGRQVYSIADNGTGFDMVEAGKLFRPFQRLSSAGSIPGFGIGLTTVERIIKRHGGEIWAEAVPGEGATFFFTIPDRDN